MSDTVPDLKSILSISGKRFIVTGGAQGIGYAIVQAIAQSGGNVVILDYQKSPPQGLDGLSTQYKVKVAYFHADVTDKSSLSRGFRDAIEALGGVDGCVTVAGTALVKAFDETSWEEFRRIQDVNVMGTYFAAQLATIQMKQQGHGGSIVMIGSFIAHATAPGHVMSAYATSKGAVKTLSENLAVELAPFRIRVNLISPGFIDTELTRKARQEIPGLDKWMVSTPPMQRIGTPGDLTGAIIYLLGDGASFTTGADIPITGGLHVGRIMT